MSSAHGCPGQRPHSSALRFSTADYAARDRLQAWRELYGRTLLNLEIEPLDTREIHTDVLMRRVPGLGLIVGSRSGSIYRRERIDNDDVVMTIGVSNGFQATQFGRIASMDRSEAVVVTGAAPGHVRMPGGGRFITLCVPRHAISPSVTGLDAAFCRPITADNTALKLLTRYIGVLEEAETFAAPDLQRHTVTHVHDLIALAIGATRDAAEVATLRGARAARLRAIKEDIANNLGTDLSIAAMATRHRLPVRYVQRLFEAEDVTFTEFVLGHRLACAYRLLTDPRLVRRPVATIAFEAGFRDLSHFNRAFRRRYGDTPSGVRTGARRMDA